MRLRRSFLKIIMFVIMVLGIFFGWKYLTPVLGGMVVIIFSIMWVILFLDIIENT